MTTKKEIKNKFSEIRNDVKDAKTLKALSFLSTKSAKFFYENKAETNVKYTVIKEYNKTLKAISYKRKILNK